MPTNARSKLAELQALHEKATPGSSASALSCAVCQKRNIVLTAFSNEQHAVVCSACWDKLRNALPILIRAVQVALEVECRNCSGPSKSQFVKDNCHSCAWKRRVEALIEERL